MNSLILKSFYCWHYVTGNGRHGVVYTLLPDYLEAEATVKFRHDTNRVLIVDGPHLQYSFFTSEEEFWQFLDEEDA